ncbi:hypothetical protein AVEN_180285-1 [Araneus ventricosus]|uniref:Uncharacterized protein n=1 Tax=Araneus ventricosus TaxID=182803 RepID=A0A4Y2HZ75_ARAVE|nr:hypothetical protein AVEN_180285-1 [Araneus ventricosus]
MPIYSRTDGSRRAIEFSSWPNTGGFSIPNIFKHSNFTVEVTQLFAHKFHYSAGDSGSAPLEFSGLVALSMNYKVGDMDVRKYKRMLGCHRTRKPCTDPSSPFNIPPQVTAMCCGMIPKIPFNGPIYILCYL